MTISTEVRKAGPFIGNDSASVFPFAFKVFKAADLIVVRRQDNIGVETTLVLDSDYHVTLNVNQDTTPGGVVTLTGGALADGFTLIVSSELPYLQTTDLTNQGGFYPKVITNALDRLTIFCQQLAENLGRTLKLPITAPTNISAEIPLPNPSELIAWNETGTGLTTVSPQSLVTSIAYGSATADLFAGDGVTTTFPLSTNPASVNNLDVSIGGYSQRPAQGGVGDYSWNGGASITFVTPPPAPTVPGDKNVLVRYMQAIPVSDSEALHAQTREALRRGYAEAGYNLVDGSFETGGTLASTTDVLLLESTGAAYAWTGAYPVGGYDVAPGIDPTVVVGFELRKDVTLRSISAKEISSVSEIKGATWLAAGDVVRTLGYSSANDGGHGVYDIITAIAYGITPDEIGGAFTITGTNLVAVLRPGGDGFYNSLQFGITTSDSTSALQALAAKEKIRLKTNTVISAPWQLQDGVYLDLNGCELFCNHSGFATANSTADPLDSAVIYGKGTFRSASGISGNFIAGNSCLLLTNSIVFDVHFQTWGEDAISARGGCFCDRITFDDIRDNPYTTVGDNNILGSIVGGSCGGDFILLKGNRNIVKTAIADVCGYRADATNFTAGSGFVMGADGDASTDNVIEYGYVGTWGALLLATAGNNNRAGTIIGGSCGYVAGSYAISGALTGKCELLNLAGNGNCVDFIQCDTTPRGLGIGSTAASDNKVKHMQIGNCSVGYIINIDRTDNANNELTRAVVGNAKNSGAIIDNGTNSKIGWLTVKKGTGGGSNAASFTGAGTVIGRLEYAGDSTSSANGIRFSGSGQSVDDLSVAGFRGFNVEFAAEVQVGKFNVSNYTGAYDNIIKVNGSGLKMVLSGGKTTDVTGSNPPKALNGATLRYVANRGQDATADGTSSVVNAYNLS